MSIFTSNDFKRGFKEGKNDAQNAKDKSYIKSGLSLKFALHGDNAITTYTEGYDAGYLEGLKEKLIVRKVEIKPIKPKVKEIKKPEIEQNKSTFIHNKNYNTMSLQKIELQLEALERLKAFLNEFETELNEKMNQFNDKVHGLRENGLPEEIAVNYDQNYCIPIGTQIYQIREAIRQRDLPYVNRQIEIFEQAREAANINY